MNEYSVQLENITKFFRMPQQKQIFGHDYHSSFGMKASYKVLDDVSFNVKKGEIIGIIGKNGSGKTTLLRIIAQVYKPDKGIIKINGRLSPMLQLGTGFQKDLAAKDNIMMNGMLLGLAKSEIESKVANIIEYAELEKFSELPIKYYSSGMRARLAFSIALQINPDIFLIDEVLSVGDKDFQKKSYETFLSLKKKNKTVIHTTHALSKVAEFSDKALLLDKGKAIMIGKPKDVIRKYQNMNSIKQ